MNIFYSALLLSSFWMSFQDLPEPVRDVWLRFHEQDLCQGVDVVFSYHDKALEVWCRIDDDKSFQKLTEMIAPLRSKYTVEIYQTRAQHEKKSPEDKDPPPSVWNNAEIRQYLEDPMRRGVGPVDSEPPRPVAPGERDPYFFLKQRMMMFASQLLDWDRKIKRYSSDLGEIAQVAGVDGEKKEFRARALALLREHALAIDKFSEKLAESLIHALPQSARKSRSSDAAAHGTQLSPLAERALIVSVTAQAITRRIYLFINPQEHTVGLADLKQPSLLESLKTLRSIIADLNRSIQAR